MSPSPPSTIADWHAHVYFDATSRDAAWRLRELVATALQDRIGMGRFHEKPVGPHPMWSYQMTIRSEHFTEVIGWLALNHGALDLLVHPNTGDDLVDHRDRALWIGRSHELDLTRLAA